VIGERTGEDPKRPGEIGGALSFDNDVSLVLLIMIDDSDPLDVCRLVLKVWLSLLHKEHRSSPDLRMSGNGGALGSSHVLKLGDEGG